MGTSGASHLAMRRLLFCLSCFSASFAEELDPQLAAMLDSYRRLDGLVQLIQREHADGLAQPQLWAGAYRGLVAGLDADSRYFTAEEALLRQGGGFGFDYRVEPESGAVRVLRVAPRGAAASAGLAPGAVILAIGGQELAPLPPARRRELLDGAREQLALRAIFSDGSTAELQITTSTAGDDGIAEARWLDQAAGIACLAISRFLPGTGNEPSPTMVAARRHLDRLREEGLHALVLDLRGNGGGDLRTAVDLADELLDAGPEGRLIVQQVSRHPAHSERHLATGLGTYPSWPLACVIDGGTASSAEILAAALREHRRAVLIGSRSIGKVSVQRDYLLDDGGILHLTVARWLTPEGRNLHGQGLNPDIAAEETPVQVLTRFREQQARLHGEPAADTDAPCRAAADALRAVLVSRPLVP